MPGPMGGAGGGGFSGGGRAGGSYSGGSHSSNNTYHYNPAGASIYLNVAGKNKRNKYNEYSAIAICLFIIMLIFLIIFVFSILYERSDNDVLVYDEYAFHSYANSRYEEAFLGTDEYESNILLLFAVHEGYDLYHCIAWGGNDIIDDTDKLFGAFFKNKVRDTIPDYFENEMTKSLENIIETMTAVCPAHPLYSEKEFDTRFSLLYNDTELEIDSFLIDDLLKDFTEKTSYPISIVIVDAKDVFTDDDSNDDLFIIFGVSILLLFSGGIIAMLILSKKTKKNLKKKKAAKNKYKK